MEGNGGFRDDISSSGRNIALDQKFRFSGENNSSRQIIYGRIPGVLDGVGHHGALFGARIRIKEAKDSDMAHCYSSVTFARKNTPSLLDIPAC
jgi:hypothetical protein